MPKMEQPDDKGRQPEPKDYQLPRPADPNAPVPFHEQQRQAGRMPKQAKQTLAPMKGEVRPEDQPLIGMVHLNHPKVGHKLRQEQAGRVVATVDQVCNKHGQPQARCFFTVVEGVSPADHIRLTFQPFTIGDYPEPEEEKAWLAKVVPEIHQALWEKGEELGFRLVQPTQPKAPAPEVTATAG